MNYRHSYHAGNFADVFKHALQARIIEYLKRKDKAFRVYDTHAGAGAYSLSPEDNRDARGNPPEWVNGIGRLRNFQLAPDLAELLGPYLEIALGPDGLEGGRYPGSPLLVRRLLRPADRLSAYELHPEDAETLRQTFEGDHQVRVTHLDGWLVPNAHVPPKEKRGMVLIDPPFEIAGDFERMELALKQIAKRWEGGIVALWYPLKHDRQVADFKKRLTWNGPNDVVAFELETMQQGAEPRLHGTGMIVRNAPFTLASEMEVIGKPLAGILEAEPGHGRYRFERLTAE